jgi:hypothetical protein
LTHWGLFRTIRLVHGRRTKRSLVALLFTSAILVLELSHVSRACAQQAICPPIAKDQQVTIACRPVYAFSAMRMLADFTVDHLYKPAPWSFERTFAQSAQGLALQELKDNPDLARFLTLLPAVRFTQLDRSTGTLLGTYDKAERVLEASLTVLAGEVTFSLEVPERLEGGYWRSPDVVQMAFWQGKRLRLKVRGGGGPDVGGEVSCASLTPEGLTVTFAESGVPPLVILFRGCLG